MYRVEQGTEFVFKGYATPLGALQPGNYITISNAQPVTYRDGHYVQSAEN